MRPTSSLRRPTAALRCWLPATLVMLGAVATGALWLPQPARASEAPATTARWIWYPERAAADCINQWRCFRRQFTLPEAPADATLHLIVDDSFEAFVNGMPARESERAGHGSRLRVGNLLRAGENVLAVRAFNGGNVAGVIGVLEARLASGQKVRIPTDASWRASREAPEGWQAPAFDDRAWSPAREVGDAFTAPWFEIGYGAETLATPEELALRAARLRRERQEMDAALAFLAREPRSRAQVRFRNGWAQLVIDGQPEPPMLYSPRAIDPATPGGARLIGQFRDAGIHLYHIVLNGDVLWRAPGRYDFAAWDRPVQKILALDPKARIFLGLRLDSPGWWLDAHPKEIIGYATGPAQSGVDQILRFRAASMASEVWRRDTGAMVRAALRHLEASPWGKRVVAYQLNYGVYCEWHYYGMASDMPDTGPAMTQAFRAWLRREYHGDLTALRAAWKDPAVTFDAAPVPDRAARLRTSALIFRDPATADRRVLDYYQCHQRVVADCLLHFCRAVKEETAGRALTGAWYGYFFGMGYPPEGHHLLLGEILRSPAVDFLSSPYCYDSSARAVGGDGQTRTVAESFRLHGKLHLYEADLRTHLAGDANHPQAHTREETIALLRREFAQAFLRGGGLWWVDFGASQGEGWFDDPAVLAEIARLRRIAVDMSAGDGTSASQVAVVCDPPSVATLGYPPEITYRLPTRVVTELNRTGAPFDTILLEDLDRKDLPDYRVFIFLNAFHLDTAQRERVARVVRRKGRTALWLYGAGFLSPRGADAAQMESLTGIRMGMIPARVRQVMEIPQGTHPLVAALPSVTRTTVAVERSQPVAGAADPANWNNPRSAAANADQYDLYALEKGEAGVTWRVLSKGTRWTDIHLLAPLPACDALSVRVRAGHLPCSFRVDLVDARGIPWSSVPLTIEEEGWQTFSLPITDIQLAPYARERAPAPQFPIQATKIVADLRPGTEFALTIGEVAAQWGRTRSERVCLLGDPDLTEGPLFFADDPAATALGFITHGVRRRPALAERQFTDWTSVVVTVPFASREFLAGLLDRAGVHRLLRDGEGVLLANRSLLALHSRTGGARKILAGNQVLVDLVTGERLLPAEGATTVELAPASTRLFRREESGLRR